MRLTEYHCEVAVLKNRNLDSEAAKKLAAYEDLGYSPEEIETIIEALKRTIDYIDMAMFCFSRDNVTRMLLNVRNNAKDVLMRKDAQ